MSNSEDARRSLVEDGVTVGPRTRIWEHTKIRSGSKIGSDCIIGQWVYIGPGVTIGDKCKIQNSALLYEPLTIGEGVFIGPGVIFTNDRVPRAVNPDGSMRGANDWSKVGVVVEEGASIGAGAVCVAPLRVGAWSLVAAGSVVVTDVASHSLVQGVPARHSGWVGRYGIPLTVAGDKLVCPVTGETYLEIDGQLLMEHI